jgi:lipid II:glycine glycyltransferase (peptidoglycan interpeptide bridge formation enzyme)
MIFRSLREEEKNIYNTVVHHPLQTWEWGEFRKKSGVKVERIGSFDQGKLKKAIQVTFHQLPLINKTVGYFPRGYMPDEDQLATLRQLAEKHNSIFIKLEPNVAQKVDSPSAHNEIQKFLRQNGAVPGRPFFAPYTFHIDLTQSVEKLFLKLSNKTRYNVNLASRKGVEIFENSTEEGMEQYIQILEETTKRQGFYLHTPEYFRQMWQTMGQSGMIRIFNAVYQDTILVSWVMFVFNGVLYYPYGASRAVHRDVMASNLMLWEMITWGKSQGCHTFDLWGSLGPKPNQKDPWFGFHRFKKGYGGDLMEFVGTYDFVVNEPYYKIFRLVEGLRWKLLRLRARLPF